MKCPKCGSCETAAMTHRTVYECGSSDLDQQPETFKQSDNCKAMEEQRRFTFRDEDSRNSSAEHSDY